MKMYFILSGNPYFQNSASANRWRTLIDGLNEMSVEIELLITEGYNKPSEYRLMGKKGGFNGIQYRYLVKYYHHNIWLRRMYAFVLNDFFRRLTEVSIKRIISKNRESIVWSDSSYNSFRLIVSLRKTFPEIKTMVELSEYLDIHKYNNGNILQKKQADLRQYYFEHTAFSQYDGLSLMTKTLFKHYQQFPEPRPGLLHLPMTVDLDRFNNTPELLPGFEKPYIAFVGVMSDAKEGVNILIKAFSEISRIYPNLKLYLVGGWNYDTPAHQKLIRQLNLEKRILWKGEMNRDQIPAIVSNASLLVLPRPDSKQAQGGFPTKLGEYLATGNPVCATTVGELPDYLVDGESVYFAEPGSVESFAKAMRRALYNPEETKIVGHNGRKVAEINFNKEIQAKKLFEFLEKL